MTSMFQFGSRQGTSADVTSVSRQTTATSGGVSTYSTRDVGAMLRERREAMGVTLAEAESATRIRQKYIAALESDEWHLLPGEVVGRGFLRNYSSYLGMEPTDVIERRRSVTDAGLSSMLGNTSAGSSLPPVRQVDYRPKDVELLDEAEGMETREVRLGPIFAAIFLLALLALLWWGRAPIADMTTAAVDSLQALAARPAPTAIVSTPAAAGIVNPQNTVGSSTTDAGSPGGVDGGVDTGAAGGEQPPAAVVAPVLVPTATPTAAPPTPTPLAPEGPTVAPTETPVPLPTPTEISAEAAAPPAAEVQPEEPILLPTEVPVEEEVLVVAPVCPDLRSVIASPGVNETVSGAMGVTGTAIHDAFQYYKLEYAPGADAGGGFVYFDGGNAPVVGGLLGGLDTTILPNGAYTIHLIVVDATGNFPPPCRVTVNIQN